MFVYSSVVNENIANHIQQCSFGGRRVFVLSRKFIHLCVSCSKVLATRSPRCNKSVAFSFDKCGFCVLRCLVRGFYFACRFTLALCMFIFIFTSAEHWWLRAARGARASSRVAPRLLGRRLGPAGGCQGRPWPLPEGCQGRQRILVAAPGLLLGCLWVAFGPQGGGRVACGPLPGGRQGRQSTLLVAPGGCC